MPNPLIDKTFLKQLDEYPLRNVYVRIISLTNDEYPIDEIQGRATAGSINIDGSSAVRRTCSLTLLADNLDTKEYYWGLKTKFKLEVGLQNYVDDKYSNIIWFPQGIYLITQFSTSQNGTGYTINISGKDKMALLNGDISGKIHANSTRFDIIDEYDEHNNLMQKKIPIREMISELVHEYGNEPFHNIVINDVDDFGLELLEYRGNDALYLGLEDGTESIASIRIDDDWPIYGHNGSSGGSNFRNIKDDFHYATFTSNSGFGQQIYPIYQSPDTIKFKYEDTKQYKIVRIGYGQTAGYRLTELIYPDELVVSAGETVTGVLDKIKTFLNDFEYFYDLEGKFIFQRKPMYSIKSWSPLKSGVVKDSQERSEYYVESMMDVSPISYQFQSNKLITSISNNPDLSNVKNDFSIWGKRTSISGAEIPIHLRFAIQKKPVIYKKISDNGGLKGTIYIALPNSASTNTESIATQQELVTMAQGLEHAGVQTTGLAYADWRELIYQMALDYRRCNHDEDYEYQLKLSNPDLVKNGKTGYEQYYVDMEGFWLQLYNPYKSGTDGYTDRGWNESIETNPESLNFWFDFLETEGDMGRYSVDIIGDRAQIVNNDKIKAIYYRDTPLIIYYLGDSKEKVDTDRSKTGYTYVQLNNITSLFSISSQGKTARDELDNQLQNYTYASQSISISALPIYYLQPNTRIEISNNDNLDLNGEYIISKITLPLTHNGTMSISAVKDPQTIL